MSLIRDPKRKNNRQFCLWFATWALSHLSLPRHNFWNLFSHSRDMEVAHTNIIAHIIEALNYIWMGKLIFCLSRPSSFGRWSKKEKYNWWKVCGRPDRKQNVFWSIQEGSIMKMELTIQFKVGITSLSKRTEVIV